MAILHNSLIPAAEDGYTVDYSCRFNRGTTTGGDAVGLHFDPSSNHDDAGNWTFSCWVKRGNLGGSSWYDGQRIFEAGYRTSGSDDNIIFLGFNENDKLKTWSETNGSLNFNSTSTAVFRDPAAFYHIVFNRNGTSLKVYVNNVEHISVTLSSSTAVYGVGSGYPMVVGASTKLAGETPTYYQPLDGHIADVHFVDGVAKTPSDFAETDSNGQWVPKEYTGSHGTNGFHLPFSNTAGATTFSDSSSSAHAITVNGTVSHSRAEKKVGNSSIYQDNEDDPDGNENYISIADHSDWDISGDYTFEGWFNIETMATSSGSQGIGFFSLWDSTNDQQVGLLWSAYSNRFFIYDEGGNDNFSESGWGWTPSTDTWYHIALVIKYNTSTSIWTTTLYINGKYINSTDALSYGSMTGTMYIGSMDEGPSYYSRLGGYMDEIRISNSQRYHGTNTSEWGNYLGSSGTNSWDYSSTAPSYDNDSNTVLLIHSDWGGGLGGDSSGNSNDFTATNLGSEDQVIDTPSAGRNHATWNPLTNDIGTLTEGNLKADGTDNRSYQGTLGLKSGKWQWEVYVGSGSYTPYMGVTDTADDTDRGGSYQDAGRSFIGNSLYKNNTATTTEDEGDANGSAVFGFALDLDSSPKTLKFYKDGTLIHTDETISADVEYFPLLFTTNSGGPGWRVTVLNCGQDPSFIGNHSTSETEFAYPISGYNAIKTANLPDPGINNLKASEKSFEVATWSGTRDFDNSAGTEEQNVSIGFHPNMVWVKDRRNHGSYSPTHYGSYGHWLFDTIQGVGKAINPSGDQDSDRSSTTLVSGEDGISSFSYGSGTTAGFTVDAPETNFNVDTDGDGTADNAEEYVAWAWKLANTGSSSTWASGNTDPDSEIYNADAGISVIKFTGTNTNWDNATRSINHSLGTAPDMMITFGLTPQWGDFKVWHKDLSSGYYLNIDDDSGESEDTGNYYYSSSPSSNTTATYAGYLNGDGQSYQSILISSIAGYSSVGTYEGNGSPDGPMITLDHSTRFLMVKNIDNSYGWVMLDSARNAYNAVDRDIMADSDSSEYQHATNSHFTDFCSNGFKIRNSQSAMNSSGDTYIYYAVGDPLKFSLAR